MYTNEGQSVTERKCILLYVWWKPLLLLLPSENNHPASNGELLLIYHYNVKYLLVNILGWITTLYWLPYNLIRSLTPWVRNFLFAENLSLSSVLFWRRYTLRRCVIGGHYDWNTQFCGWLRVVYGLFLERHKYIRRL